MDIEEIRSAFTAGRYQYRGHARQRMLLRGITNEELGEAISSGEVIEEYPAQFYGACCLIYGRTSDHRPVHVVLSAPSRGWIITVYEPDDDEWIDYRIRRNLP